MVNELARRGALLKLSLVISGLPFLTSFIHSLLLSHCRCSVSSKFFDLHVPSVSAEELLHLRHLCCVLSRLHCYGTVFC